MAGIDREDVIVILLSTNYCLAMEYPANLTFSELLTTLDTKLTLTSRGGGFVAGPAGGASARAAAAAAEGGGPRPRHSRPPQAAAEQAGSARALPLHRLERGGPSLLNSYIDDISKVFVPIYIRICSFIDDISKILFQFTLDYVL